MLWILASSKINRAFVWKFCFYKILCLKWHIHNHNFYIPRKIHNENVSWLSKFLGGKLSLIMWCHYKTWKTCEAYNIKMICVKRKLVKLRELNRHKALPDINILQYQYFIYLFIYLIFSDCFWSRSFFS